MHTLPQPTERERIANALKAAKADLATETNRRVDLQRSCAKSYLLGSKATNGAVTAALAREDHLRAVIAGLALLEVDQDYVATCCALRTASQSVADGRMHPSEHRALFERKSALEADNVGIVERTKAALQ